MKELRAALRAVDAGQRAALVFVTDIGGSTPRSTGARMAVLDDGTTVGTIGGGEVEHRVIALALDCIASGRPGRFDAHLTRDLGMCCGGRMTVHVDPLLPSPSLVVFGAGHVAHAFVPMAAALGFTVTVVDDRDELNTADRFPTARHHGDPRRFADGLPDDPDRHVLIVTHDHALDLDLCRTLLPREHAWVGMIGSRAKVSKFRVRLRAAGLTDPQLERLQAPVGLDLGAETPAEIAVAIAAQLVQHRRGHDAPAERLSVSGRGARGGSR
jgi:xanthine dehydrogenase accessory factor